LKTFIITPQNTYKPNVFEKTFHDGSSYKGELRDNKRSGKGMYYYKNGDKYFGDWDDDKFHG